MNQKIELNGNGVTSQQVEVFLRENPGFFEENLELLASIELPHPTSGETISLIQRQLSVLREQNRGLERKLTELIQIARDNERLSMCLHTFSNNLLETRSVSDVLAVTHDTVRELFDTEFVSIKLYENITDEVQLSISNSHKQKMFFDIVNQGKPICGQLTQEQLKLLFANNMEHIISSAITPLKATQDLGVLALGSTEKGRFKPSMGHLFLSHLGDLVSSALACHL